MAFSYKNLKIKWKILLLAVPLAVVPVVLVGNMTGFIANRQAYLGITDASKADLDHMATFTTDMLNAHHRQFILYNEERTSADRRTVSAEAFEKKAFEDLKRIIKSKKVGDTGYIYCINSKGLLTVHPAQEGENIYESVDSSGFPFIKEMTRKKEGWIRYPWKNPGEREARMKIVRYVYFKPWDWIVAVGSYENEFYREANLIQHQIFEYMVTITVLASIVAVILVLWVSSKLTGPISGMIDAVRRIKSGEQGIRMAAGTDDEIGELAENFNTMIETIEKHNEMESLLNQQTKMVSLGVLASEVAHEINNPLGVILGYASHLESKISPGDPAYKFVNEIKNEGRRCKKIVENFLSYARIPSPHLKETDINALIEEISGFAANHPDFRHLAIVTDFDRSLPMLMIDEDQIRQVAINIIANAAGAVGESGRLFIKTEPGDGGVVNIYFEDNGSGIPADEVEKIFEPFYTTKPRGTGLGLPIVRQIIKQHLGSVRVESTGSRGTTLVVSLPVKGGLDAR